MKSPAFALAVGALFALGAATAACAQWIPPGSLNVSSQDIANAGLPIFGALDWNNEGQLRRSDIPKDMDALQPLRAHFRDWDKDHNGHLSSTEYTAYVQSRLPESEQKPGQSQR